MIQFQAEAGAPMVEIRARSWAGGAILHRVRESTVGAAVAELGPWAKLATANLFRADLRGAQFGDADLAYADLSEADLRGADLSRATLVGANLFEADLRGADLHQANLARATLRRAKFDGARIDWDSHELLAELLLQAAGHSVERRKVAGLILISRDWCWAEFDRAGQGFPADMAWAVEVLAGYIHPEEPICELPGPIRRAFEAKGGAR